MQLYVQSAGFTYPYLRSFSSVMIGDHVMEMYLQYGYGMMAHTRELLSKWSGGGVVLSPRDLTETQLQKMAKDVLLARGEPLLDPQCYARDADHARLVAHEYWQVFRSHSTGSLMQGPGMSALLSSISRLSKSLGIKRHILPGLMANQVNDDWFEFSESIIDEAEDHFADEPVLATVSLSSSAMGDENQIEAIVERASNWNVNGFYVVAETPSAYLVDNPGWLANLLILTSGLKLLKKQVIVGYCSHQMLCLAATKVDAIASGTWLNVRAFPPEKFYSPEEGDISRRAIWYYCPHALSEYKLPFLDIAQRTGILTEMRPKPELGSIYAEELFSGNLPTSIGWSEQSAFRHYLTCLHSQVSNVQKSTFDDTIAANTNLLDNAQSHLSRFRENGIFGQDREFWRFIDVNKSALTVFQKARGSRLRRLW